MKKQRQLFLDNDGVLADFDQHVINLLGEPPRQLEARLGAKEFWKRLHAIPGYYFKMPLMADAKELVAGCIHHHPIILTGCPQGGWAEEQKQRWKQVHFPELDMICCLSKDKRNFGGTGDVLIDDWEQHKDKWIEMGGIFITHTDAKSSLEKLKEWM